MLSYLFCHPITHICSAGEERKREKREKIVHLPLENGLPLYFYHRVTSTAVVSSSVVVIVVVLLSALANIAMHVCMCVPEISSLIVVRLHSRRICVVFISIFNISLLFLFFFPFLSHTSAVSPFLLCRMLALQSAEDDDRRQFLPYFSSCVPSSASSSFSSSVSFTSFPS